MLYSRGHEFQNLTHPENEILQNRKKSISASIVFQCKTKFCKGKNTGFFFCCLFTNYCMFSTHGYQNYRWMKKTKCFKFYITRVLKNTSSNIHRCMCVCIMLVDILFNSQERYSIMSIINVIINVSQ